MGVLKRPAALALTVTIFLACDFSRKAPLVVEGEQIAVYSVLEAGSDTVSVFIVRVPVNTDPGEPPFFPVSGADVQIATAAGSPLSLEEASRLRACFIPSFPPVEELSRSGCYRAAAPSGVQPGGRYRLHVELPGGSEIEGATVVPKRPDITAPEAGARIEVEIGFDTEATIVVRFDAPPAAARLHLVLLPMLDRCRLALEDVPHARVGQEVLEAANRGDVLIIPDVQIGKVIVRFREIDCEVENPIPIDTLPVRLLLVAYDSAYAHYASRVLDPELGVTTTEVSAGLTGAFGLFAGAASTRRRIVLVPPE